MLKPRLGARIRRLRLGQSLSLEQLSKRSGLSRAAISKIERGAMSPTYESLCKVADGLQIDLAQLIGDGVGGGGDRAHGRTVVTRAGRGAKYQTKAFNHELLAEDAGGGKINAFVSEICARTEDEYADRDAHDTEDFVYVLAGAVKMFVGDDRFDLAVGDSISFDGRQRHAVLTISPDGRDEAFDNAKVLWVSVKN